MDKKFKVMCVCSNYNCEAQGYFEPFSECKYCSYIMEPVNEKDMFGYDEEQNDEFE